jgi:hypothetical protein
LSIIHSDPAEAVAVRYFSKLNSVLGPLTIGVAFSINSLKLAQEWAFIFLFISLLWGMFQGKEYRNLRKHRPNYKPSLSLFVGNCLIFITGYIMLSFIAVGQWVS